MKFVLLAALISTVSCAAASPRPSPSGITSDVHILASPSSIHEGFTKYMSINCTFNHESNSDFRTIMSLILSKTDGLNDNNFKEIATVTAFSNDVVDVSDAKGATVEGHLEAFSESFIAYEWRYPGADAEGKYRCEAYGMDHSGHPRDKKAITTVTERPVDMGMLLENMQKMDLELDQLLNFKQYMSSRLQNSMSAMTETTAVFNGHNYLLSKPMVQNQAVSASVCQLFGGKLLEINDQAEFNFVINMAANYNDTISLGATYDDQVDKWVFLSSGSPVTFTQWPGSQPSDKDQNCMYFASTYRGNTMVTYDDVCYDLSFNRFICEF